MSAVGEAPNATAVPADAPARKGLPVVEAAPQVPSWRLLATLGGSGALAGLLIVSAYVRTQPRIQAHRAELLHAAIAEVLQDPARADTLWLHDGKLVASLPRGVDGAKLERVYVGYGAKGDTVGYAITASEAGFADQVAVIFGYEPSTRRVLGMKVLGSKETPGLGDKIEKPGFLAQFAGRVAPLVGVKGAVPAGDTSGIAMITGATISSRTVVREMNGAIARWQPLVDAWRKEQR